MKEYPNPLTNRCLKKILNQMNNYLYKVNERNGKFDTGFFCYIKDYIPTLLINNYIKFSDNENTINISLNNNPITIEIGDTIYSNKDYNMTMIEIKRNKEIYIINWNKKIDNSSLLINKIRNIHKSHIIYSTEIKHNSDISLIFNLYNNKLIGKNGGKFKNFFKILCQGYVNKYKYIKKFKNNYKYKYKYDRKITNEIDMIIEVDNSDITKKIYFLDNYECINHFHDNLKEMNELNTKLYINNKENKFRKYFIPERKGEYNIKLKIYTDLTDLSYMFVECTNIKKINFVNFNSNKVTNMKCMFHKCRNLKSVSFFSFDTKNVTDMSDMFSFCENLNNLDLNSFKFDNAKDISYMFFNCYNLSNLNLSLSNIKNIDNKNYIFYGCKKLDYLYTINNSDYITESETINNKYENEINIFIEVNKEDINKKVYFLNDKLLKELKSSSFKIYIDNEESKFKNYFIPQKDGVYNISVEILNNNFIDCSDMFSECKNIMQILFTHFNTETVISMRNMFFKCENLIAINLSSFDTKNVIDMSHMFEGCLKLQNLDLSSFDTKNVIDMSNMFSNCENLNNLNLSSFNTGKALIFKKMFHQCKNLKTINLSSFSSLNVADMGDMFSFCVF